MNKRYDLRLPNWGPYNKKYMGVSHVADKALGLRFDLALFPGFYRRSVMLPKDLMDSGAKVMASSADASHFIYRYELTWKDKVYIDADFSSENSVMTADLKIVNATDFPESITVNAVMSMHPCSQIHVDIVDFKADFEDGVFINAVDYTDINCDMKIACDGLYLAEARESSFVGGNYLSKTHFNKSGHFTTYSFEKVNASKFGIRYRGNGKIKVKLSGDEFCFNLPESDGISYTYFDIEQKVYDRLELFPQNSELDFDGFYMGCDEQVAFSPAFSRFAPTVLKSGNKLTLLFGDKVYEVETDACDYMVRKLVTDDVGSLLSEKIHDHVSTTLSGVGSEVSCDLFIRPIFIDANSESHVKIKITAKNDDEAFPYNHKIFEPISNPEGEKYHLSQKIMGAVTLTNTVWPIYSRRGFIRHNTPGRNWDSLYTWDSGFIGMGLNAIDKKRGEDCLNSYLTPFGDKHSPCIFHGTPLPIQIFLYAQAFQDTGDIEFLKKYYPEILNQYLFFSNMKDKDIGIFSLWHIFYNSGGWDDYPPQRLVHSQKAESHVKPIINTAVTVLCAKILKKLATVLGESTEVFDKDIEFFSDVIEKYAWDEESGYYGYIDTLPTPHIFKPEGVNANMGLDGAYPYIAGISNEARSKRILGNIKAGLMTEIGVSVVDTRAPYFSDSGYWNGSVWMPHQWILWKALLDKGEFELAKKIAITALDLWKKETDHTYNTYEHFMIKNGRGAGFHQFSGLSTPILLWHDAYFKPFTVSGGFQTIITDKKTEKGNLSFKVSGLGSIIVCLPEGENYTFATTAKVVRLLNGAFSLTFDKEVCENIIISKE